MRRPKRAHPIAVTEEEVQRLEQLIRAPDTPPEVVVRARIILTAHAHPEQNDHQIATTVGTTAHTVRTWCRRWVKTRSLENLPHR
jgi:hypothetical protein